MALKPTTAEVNRLIKVWKGRLRLDSWIIGWGWANPEKLAQKVGYSCLASTDLDLAEYKALIEFDNSMDWDVDKFYSDHNFEDTVVHELLHIRSSAADDKLDNVRLMIGQFLPPHQLSIVEKMLTDARERYIESARTVVMEGKW